MKKLILLAYLMTLASCGTLNRNPATTEEVVNGMQEGVIIQNQLMQILNVPGPVPVIGIPGFF